MGDAGAKLMSTTDDTGLWSAEEGQSPPYSHSLLDIVLQNREALKGITPDKSPEKHQRAWRHCEPRTKAQMDQTQTCSIFLSPRKEQECTGRPIWKKH